MGAGMILPRWISPGAVAFVVIWFALLLSGQSGMMRDPGTFWHTTTGELILQKGFIRNDPYTFTFAGTWWVPYQWLGEVGMALAHRVAGFDTQLLAATALLAGIFAWLTTRLLKTGLHPIAVSITIVLALAAAGSHFLVRPHLFTMAALTLTTALIVEVDLQRRPLRQLFWLIPLFVLWTNIHGGVIGGLGTLGLTIVGWLVWWQLRRPSPVVCWYQVGLLILLFAASGLSVFINPYGLDLLRTWHIILGEPILKQIIQEHHPLNPSEVYAWPVLVLAGLYGILLLGVPWREIRVSWLLPLVWFVQAWDRCRHAPLFVLVGLIVMTAMWPRTRWAAWLAQTRPDFYAPDVPTTPRPWWAPIGLPVLLLAIALGLHWGKIRLPLIGVGWACHAADHWPVELLDVLKAHEPGPNEPNRLFNDYRDGGFVIYHTPGYKVFVDDRCEVFGGPWLFEFVKASSHDTAQAMTNWQLQYGRFDFALTRIGTGFDAYFRATPGWQCVKSNPTAAFYRRR
jgi:hypothetical protein